MSNRYATGIILTILVSLISFSTIKGEKRKNPDTMLPEVVVKSGRNRILHILAYVREYSTLTTYTDTVFLFREKMVDYMLPPDKKSRFQGWTTPRVLSSNSYYRFTNDSGLDSVSAASNHHFSWSDWVGLPPIMMIPETLKRHKHYSDTVRGKYSDAEIWSKNGDRLTVDINVLADTLGRKWLPDLSSIFQKKVEFEQLRLHLDYDNVLGDWLSATDLKGYSFVIESAGRGHNMFRFNRYDQDFFVNTKAEVYIIDREFITFREAKNWERYRNDTTTNSIFVPIDAPCLESDIIALMGRVENLDKEAVRLEVIPDHRFVSEHLDRKNFQLGRRALLMFKQMTGISAYKSRKNFNKMWNELRKDRKEKNKNRSYDIK